ncbi:unnamed protein product, partial [Mesorhabditis spiculigera]
MCRIVVTLLVIISTIACIFAGSMWAYIPVSMTLENADKADVSTMVCPKYKYVLPRDCFSIAECIRVEDGNWQQNDDLIIYIACNPLKTAQAVSGVLVIFGGYLLIQLGYDLICCLIVPCKWVYSTLRRNRKEFIV